MQLNLLHDAFSAYGFRIKEGAVVYAVGFDGPWLECSYPVTDKMSAYIHVHEQLLPTYFGITVDMLPADLPRKPSHAGTA